MKKNVFTNSKVFWNTAQTFIHHYLPGIRKVSRHTVSSYKDGLNSYISYRNLCKRISGLDLKHKNADTKNMQPSSDFAAVIS